MNEVEIEVDSEMLDLLMDEVEVRLERTGDQVEVEFLKRVWAVANWAFNECVDMEGGE